MVHGGGPCISRKTKELDSLPACGAGREATSRLQRFGRVCIAKQRKLEDYWRHLSATAAGVREVLADAAEQKIRDRVDETLGRAKNKRTEGRLKLAARYTQRMWRSKKAYAFNDDNVRVMKRGGRVYSSSRSSSRGRRQHSNAAKSQQQRCSRVARYFKRMATPRRSPATAFARPRFPPERRRDPVADGISTWQPRRRRDPVSTPTPRKSAENGARAAPKTGSANMGRDRNPREHRTPTRPEVASTVRAGTRKRSSRRPTARSSMRRPARRSSSRRASASCSWAARSSTR